MVFIQLSGNILANVTFKVYWFWFGGERSMLLIE